MDNQEDIQRAINRAYFYLKFRPRTKHEVTLYLQKKAEKYGWTNEVVESAVITLEEQGFINDEKFIESFVSSRSAVKPKSEFVLKSELIRLGVAKDLIDRYFEENPIPQEELAKKALRTSWSRFVHMDRKTRFEKAIQFLMRRGFSFALAKQTVNELEEASI